MEKQYTKQIKDYLLSIVSKETDMDKQTCDDVIMWIYRDTKENAHSTTSLELSGFGSFIASPHKILKRIEELENRLVIRKNIKSPNSKTIANLEARIEFLKSKYEHIKNTRGLPKSLSASQPIEGGDRGHIENTSSEMS